MRLYFDDPAGCVYQALCCFDEALHGRRFVLKDSTELQVSSDGLCVLDFRNSVIAGQMPGGGYAIGDSFQASKSSSPSINEVIAERCRIINAIEAALTTTINLEQRLCLPLRQEMTADNFIPAIVNFDSDFALAHASLRNSLDKEGFKAARSDCMLHESSLRAFLETLNQVLISSEILALADLLLKACACWSRHEFALTAVIAWGVCENLLNTAWEDFVCETRAREPGRINADRKARLGRMSADITIEILELQNLLPDGTYQRLNDARKVRNSWMHNLRRVTDEEGSNAVRLAQDLMLHVHKIRLEISMSRSGRF